MKREFCLRRTLIASLGIFLCALALGLGRARAQVGYDRPGANYAHAPVVSGNPEICARRCEHDKRCRAWSFFWPPASGGRAVCLLKNRVTPPVRSNCCVSGVRGAGVAEPRINGFEYGIDRIGGNYHIFAIKPDPTGAACAKACRAQSRCRAWTYRRPGYGSVGARCLLKYKITLPRRQPCCISGVVR